MSPTGASPRATRDHPRHLARRDVVWAVPATVVTDVNTPSMWLWDGVVAASSRRLHLLRRGIMQIVRRSIDLDGLRALEPAVIRVADRDIDAVLLRWTDDEPWAVVCDEPGRRRFLVEQLRGHLRHDDGPDADG